MSNIFISYRREDSADATGRINDRLTNYYGRNSVFTDVDNIPLGVDFRTYLDNEVAQCEVLLAVIGKDWLKVENAEKNIRLSDTTDFVRIEIESALRRDIPVIPLLVRGASVPSVEELPEALQKLAFRNAIEVRPDPDFNNDVNRLILNIDNHLQQTNSDEQNYGNNTNTESEQLIKAEGDGAQVKWSTRILRFLGVFILLPIAYFVASLPFLLLFVVDDINSGLREALGIMHLVLTLLVYLVLIRFWWPISKRIATFMTT